MSTLLRKTLVTYRVRSGFHGLTSRELRSAAAHLGIIRRDPGDLAKLGEPYFVGFAVALTFIGKGPGWIPEVQRLVCWHGHRDFLRALYRLAPDAKIRSAIATYESAEHFERSFPATGYRNVGSQMEPLDMHNACICDEGAD